MTNIVIRFKLAQLLWHPPKNNHKSTEFFQDILSADDRQRLA